MRGKVGKPIHCAMEPREISWTAMAHMFRLKLVHQCLLVVEHSELELRVIEQRVIRSERRNVANHVEACMPRVVHVGLRQRLRSVL